MVASMARDKKAQRAKMEPVLALSDTLIGVKYAALPLQLWWYQNANPLLPRRDRVLIFCRI
jgi:hypothetical protein